MKPLTSSLSGSAMFDFGSHTSPRSPHWAKLSSTYDKLNASLLKDTAYDRRVTKGRGHDSCRCRKSDPVSISTSIAGLRVSIFIDHLVNLRGLWLRP